MCHRAGVLLLVAVGLLLPARPSAAAAGAVPHERRAEDPAALAALASATVLGGETPDAAVRRRAQDEAEPSAEPWTSTFVCGTGGSDTTHPSTDGWDYCSETTSTCPCGSCTSADCGCSCELTAMEIAEINALHPQECTSSPCQNGGVCNRDGTWGYFCECALGFSGDDCEIELPACGPTPACGCGDPVLQGQDGCCGYGRGSCAELCATGGWSNGGSSRAYCWANDQCGCKPAGEAGCPVSPCNPNAPVAPAPPSTPTPTPPAPTPAPAPSTPAPAPAPATAPPQQISYCADNPCQNGGSCSAWTTVSECGCGDPAGQGHDGCCNYGRGTCAEICASGGVWGGSEAYCWENGKCGCGDCVMSGGYTCQCTLGFTGENCENEAQGIQTDIYDTSYHISGCRISMNCAASSFARTAGTCNDAPVYMDDSSENVLFRRDSAGNGLTRWYIGPIVSTFLSTCALPTYSLESGWSTDVTQALGPTSELYDGWWESISDNQWVPVPTDFCVAGSSSEGCAGAAQPPPPPPPPPPPDHPAPPPPAAVASGGCASYPCQNGGQCVEEDGAVYRCQCTTGFVGDDCEDNHSSRADDQISHDTADDTCYPCPHYVPAATEIPCDNWSAGCMVQCSDCSCQSTAATCPGASPAPAPALAPAPANATAPAPAPCGSEFDYDNNGVVGVDDLLALLASYGRRVTPCPVSGR